MTKQFTRKVDGAAAFISVRFDGNSPSYNNVPSGSFVRIFPNEDTPDELVEQWVARFRSDGAAGVVKMTKPEAGLPSIRVEKRDEITAEEDEIDAVDLRTIANDLVEKLPQNVDKPRLRAFIFDALEKAGT